MKIFYSNSTELPSGHYLTIDFCINHLPGSHHYPPEDDIGETHFRLDEKLVDRSELPSEITDAFIEELERTAKQCEGPSFDGPFDSPEDDIPDY